MSVPRALKSHLTAVRTTRSIASEEKSMFEILRPWLRFFVSPFFFFGFLDRGESSKSACFFLPLLSMPIYLQRERSISGDLPS